MPEKKLLLLGGLLRRLLGRLLSGFLCHRRLSPPFLSREFINLKNTSQRFFVAVDKIPSTRAGPPRALSRAFPRDSADLFTTEDAEGTEKKFSPRLSRES